ncbi:MAG: gluconate 2-dehydrogenase subunit 3 family protein, partial [Bacteroidetes bacterium]|nr:gluconate 2-dehydrogenase subunit 3 family protein [Bacteroidota bacterium]
AQFRGMVIDAYKSSEYVGENVLAYLPVPGEYVACDDLETLTGGVAWAE